MICFSFSVVASSMGKLTKNIPYPFYETQKEIDGKYNTITVLNSGLASLQAKLDIIKTAQQNIEVEYFEYETDSASKLLSLELIKAAKRGVEVRLLVDKTPLSFVLKSHFARALIDNGVKVKYYNQTRFYQISSMQFRNHRKLLSVDDRIAITGGRNVSDGYYEMSEKYNFNDRDIILVGDIVIYS